MVIKKLIIIAATFSFTACATTMSNKTQEKNSFRDYALAICLGSAFDSPQVKSDFNKTANGIMERGHMPLEAYEDLRPLVDLWLSKDYASKDGGQVNSAKCIDLYHSQDVEKVFEKHNPCKSKNSWLSVEEFNKHCGA